MGNISRLAIQLIALVFLIVAVDSEANYAPALSGGNRPLLSGTTVSLVPWVEDSDVWETFAYQIQSQPANGTASIVNNTLTYTPTGGYTGTDAFTYQAKDHGGATITGTEAVRVYSSADLTSCTNNSTVTGGQLQSAGKANKCTFYSMNTTRVTDSGVPVTMDYFVNWPSSGTPPKAVVVLIGGGNLNMVLSGNPATGVAVTTGGGNFVVRTAQLFADAGYLAIAIDSPSDLPNVSNDLADQYRISVKHAVDILTILKRVNTENLDVFIVGTSRGTISTVALNLIAAGISLTSSLTSDPDSTHVYIGKPGVSNLQPAFVARPVHVLWHENDLCSYSTPANSQALYSSLAAISPTTTAFNTATGGVQVTVAGNNVTPDVCGAFDYHGYLGIETTAVGYVTSWLDSQASTLAGNKRPEAAFATIAASGAPVSIELSTLTRDRNSDTLSYALSHTISSLGGSVSLNGSTATYTPPVGAGSKTDYFVYVVNDGHGGVSAAVVTIQNGTYQFAASSDGAGNGTLTSSSPGVVCGGGECRGISGMGSTVTVTANPDTGSSFAGWSGCDSESGNDCTVAMNGARNVTAKFIPVTTASGTYVYTPGSLVWNLSNSTFVCDGPKFPANAMTVTSLTDTTMIWQTGSSSTMTWTRASGSAGVITGGTWSGTNPAGSVYTATFNVDNTLTITGIIGQCYVGGAPTIGSFSPASGSAGNLVTISGSNFSPIAGNNTVLFNGVPAVVTGVRPTKLFVLVPSGATTGTISVTNLGGTIASGSPFTASASPPSATLAWGGVHHRIGADGIEYDALDAGINSYAATLSGMSLTVAGPNGFSYIFSDAEITPYISGQLAVYKKFPTPATPLAPGVYTFTLNDGQGYISHRVDTQVTVTAHVPQVDSATIQLQRKADGSYRFSWAPVNDTHTYYYKIRIYRNDSVSTPVYDSTRAMVASVDVPVGILFDDSAYKVRVEAGDSPNTDLTTNRSDSAFVFFSPTSGDYNANRLLVNTVYLINVGAPSNEFILNVDSPAAISAAIANDPNSFQLLDSTGAVKYTFLATDMFGSDFYKNFSGAAQLAPGAYTIRFAANGITHYAYVNLTARAIYPLPSTSTMQAENLGNGSIRFSWANANYTGALYYRITVNDTATGARIKSTHQNQAYADITIASLGDLTNKQWRVEVYDSNDYNTLRNGYRTSYITLATIAYDPTRPVINNYRVRNIVKPAGTAYSLISVNATASQSTLTQILVTGPGGFSHDLLADGRYSPFYGSYALEIPGTLAVGLYTIKVTDAAHSSPGVLRYIYVPAANPLPQPDFTTFHADQEPNGDMVVSWAPVVSDVPVWYTFSLYARTDQNGDGLMDPPVYFYTSPTGAQNVQQSSIVIPAAVLAGLPNMPKLWMVMAYDGSGYTVTGNSSASVMVGAENSGFNYATLVDADSDGFASDIDPDDHNPAVYPIPAGNDSLVTAINGTNPANGATGIDAASAIIGTFNKVIDQRTLPASFTLNNGVTGAVTYNPASFNASFKPSSPLLSGTTYTATISTGLKDQAGNALSSPFSWSFTVAGSLPTLSMTVTGEGNVNSDTGNPGIHSSTSGIFTSLYPWSAPVQLTAAPHSGWDFGSWGGDGTCSGSSPTCNLTMDAQTKNVTATFLVQHNIKNGSNYYGTIASAFAAPPANNNHLLLKSLTFVESPVFNLQGVGITMEGGFIDPGFLDNSGGNATVSGRLTIQNGTVRVKKITVK